jgi:UDP-N-acetylmuramyl pentapeptide phosphotransferase/UDP-N-acetylglucosamine-1-phosphate transferase
MNGRSLEEIIAIALILFLGSVVSGWALTGIVTARLRARAVMDRPVDRSSHTQPTPRGGGWGFVMPMLLAFGSFAVLADSRLLAAVGFGAAALAAVSWWDDLRTAAGGHAPILARLAVQSLAVAAPLFLLAPEHTVSAHLVPLWLERGLLALLWLWLVNLFNFMDGIDTLAAAEGIAVAAGLIALGAVLHAAGEPVAVETIALTLTLLGALGGFLFWNWPPAKVFMGDVGSVFLGYALGFLLLQMALSGAWAAALILPLAFLGDATLTLTKRLLRGEKVWRAHREHAYQRAVTRGESHGAVSLKFAALNLLLIALAVTSLLYPWSSLAAAIAATLVFLLRLGRAG